MRRRTVQPKIRSFVSLLRSPVTPFDGGKTIAKSANFTKNANWTFLATESVNSAPFKRGETKVQIFGKAKCKTLRQFQRFGKESANFFANFSATKVTSLPSISLSLSLYLSLSHRAHLTHNRKRFRASYSIWKVKISNTCPFNNHTSNRSTPEPWILDMGNIPAPQEDFGGRLAVKKSEWRGAYSLGDHRRSHWT